VAFCKQLSDLTGRTYTLPSEAQWEYACRAGTTSPFHFGGTVISELANVDATQSYGEAPRGGNRGETSAVGLFPANGWGLHDLHGNVWEWCLDAWHDSYTGAPDDGRAWLDRNAEPRPFTRLPPGWIDKDDELSDTRRLLRGGSWINLAGNCRSAYRFFIQPGYASNYVGFRVVCLPQGPTLHP
jgi:formylglycine-generating enzyme required for sulfatase activity